MIIETISLIATIIAITGVIANNRKLSICFWLWLWSNGLTLIVHLYSRLWMMSMRDMIFMILALQGMWLWQRK